MDRSSLLALRRKFAGLPETAAKQIGLRRLRDNADQIEYDHNGLAKERRLTPREDNAMMYDFSGYTVEELRALILTTNDQITTMRGFTKLTKADRAQIRHDEEMLAAAEEALMCKSRVNTSNGSVK